MTKTPIPGIILIFSCHKHLYTRVYELSLRKEYEGWLVYIVVGNPFISAEYEMSGNHEKNGIPIMTIKCEDSYIHILKKVGMAIHIMTNILYDIQEGIVRCGDDLEFNETKLCEFLSMPNKADYMGGNIIDKNIKEYTKDTKKKDDWMVNYFVGHLSDIDNPINGLQKIGVNQLLQMNERPIVPYAGGVVVYLSNRSCQIITRHLIHNNWNIFKYHPAFGYPYMIEDIGIGFIMYMHQIVPVRYPLYTDKYELFELGGFIAAHTNSYK